jgi:hypothetical protein
MKNNPWTVAIGAALVGALIIFALEILRENQKGNLPLEQQGTRVKPNETDFDVVNPATRPRRIQEAWFLIRKLERPSQPHECGAMIDTVDITFTTNDYIPKRNAYYKRLGEDEIHAQEEGSFRVKIVDSSRVGWKYYGTLVVVYGDNDGPKCGTWDGYYVTVSDVDELASSSTANHLPPPNRPHLTPDGTAPDGRRPIRHWFNTLPAPPSYQPVEVK